MGEVFCIRQFGNVLENARVRLTAGRAIGKKAFCEIAMVGLDSHNLIAFWSFTSDQKDSGGVQTNGSDVHDEAIGFEANVPAGVARMIYWPHEEKGFCRTVESKTKQGWNRFTEHRYARFE